MKWRAFATDFDGTIATDGTVDGATMDALRAVRESGRVTFLVTGRELKDFETAPGILPLFDAVVAENGAVFHRPSTGDLRLLASPPAPHFAEELRRRGIPLSVGHVIVATVEPHHTAVLEVIRENALELQVIFNKGAVMILPAAVNKATGLKAALDSFGLTPDATIAVGDAENDHAFLECSGLPVAVANALPALKDRVAFVTQSNAGAGVTELIRSLLDGCLDHLPQSTV